MYAGHRVSDAAAIQAKYLAVQKGVSSVLAGTRFPIFDQLLGLNPLATRMNIAFIATIRMVPLKNVSTSTSDSYSANISPTPIRLLSTPSLSSRRVYFSTLFPYDFFAVTSPHVFPLYVRFRLLIHMLPSDLPLSRIFHPSWFNPPVRPS